MRYLPVAQAIQITGHPTAAALRKWVYRLRQRHPHLQIHRRYGTILESDLLAAIELDSQPAITTTLRQARQILANSKARK